MMTAAQDVTEPALKAAFIYNFAKFTEWPTEAVPTGAPFGVDPVSCTVSERQIRERLAGP